ncbi:MAG: efflux RND transporter periplasmic adaptor subunit [Euzebyales bacterium]|nr:efflux RND transporter periplasmic adaptor subunit [Euzebyales bacterium]
MHLPRSSRLLAACACLLVLVACTGDELPVVEVERVTAAEVRETVSAPARVDAAARQDVAAPISGVIIALEAADGDAVEPGQLVARLDSTQIDLARQQAAAAQQATSSVGGIAVQGSGRATLQAVEEAVADLDVKVSPKLEAAREDAAAISDEHERAAAEAAVDAVEVAYLSSRAGLLTTGETLASSQDAFARSVSDALNQAVQQATAAQRAQAQAAAQAAQVQADQLDVTAPFAGTVQLGEAAATDGAALPPIEGLPSAAGDLAGTLGGLPGSSGAGTLRVGAPVVAGQTLFTVFDLSERFVNAEVDEVDAPAVAIGQRADVLVDAAAEETFEGVVEAVRVEATSTEAGGIGYEVRIRVLPPPEGAEIDGRDDLLVGMTASVEIATRTIDADIAVPSRAILRREAGQVVVVVRDGAAREIPVRVVGLGEELAAVEGELSTDDRVVVRGYEGLIDGAAVQVGRVPDASEDEG